MTAWPAGLALPAAEAMQRAFGRVRIAANAAGLADLEQRGCLRACFPRAHGGATEAVIVNTAGGIADGDELSLAVEAGPGADIIITTPSAERIYRARTGAPPARMNVRLNVATGARLAFLPQETILFDHSALHRRLDIDLAPGASYLGVEALIFGRQRSGETLSHLRLRDTICLRQDGRLTLHDAIRLDGAVAPFLAHLATSGGARALATLLLAGADAEAALPAIRELLPSLPIQAGASAWNGMLVVRLLARDAQALRQAIVAALAVLREGRPLPRVWSS